MHEYHSKLTQLVSESTVYFETKSYDYEKATNSICRGPLHENIVQRVIPLKELPCIITCPGNYKLANNITVRNEDVAIVVACSNVTLDLNGFNLKGKNTKVGILILNKVTRVNVINGSLIGFDVYAIYSDGEAEFVKMDSIIADRCGNKPGDISITGSIVFIARKGCSNQITIKNSTVTRTENTMSAILIGDLGSVIYNVVIENCTVNFCSSMPSCISAASMSTIRGCKINNCNKIDFAVYCRGYPGEFVTISDCIIENNTDIIGAVVTSEVSSIIRNITHQGNKHIPISTESNYSATILCNGRNSSCEDIIIKNNLSTSELRGCFILGGGTSVKNVAISNNTAAKILGVLASDYSNLAITGSFNVDSVQLFDNIVNEYSLVSVNKYQDTSAIQLSVTNCKSQFNKGTGFAYDMRLASNSLVDNCLSQGENGGIISENLPLTVSNCKFIYDTIPLEIGLNTTTYNNLVV